jgi:hypothetical protein
MKKTLLNCVAAALALQYGIAVMAEDKVVEATFDAQITRAAADYKVAMAKCAALDGNPQDICEADAQKTRELAEGTAKANHEGTAEARAEARKKGADAELALAKQKCDQLTGNEQDVCVKEAQLIHTRAVTTSDTNQAVAEASDERFEAVDEAQYKLAMEKCESLQGDAQDVCELGAKAHSRHAE